MTAIRVAASTVLALVAAASAHAAEPNAAPAPAPVAASSAALVVTLAAGPAALAHQASPKARYCFQVERVGSRIAPKVCQTRAQWEANGVDLDAALAGR
ncbi:hypothetical protein [Sphingomonas sp. Leaf4]|uniref:hypothetical protein n=1 Tax=Sphingomonas sp. Leaf4 TaxID=2876553 RepID=UPI001E5B1142|nr:hypothetical protein [Sphingomonas sp. Leaf4]